MEQYVFANHEEAEEAGVGGAEPLSPMYAQTNPIAKSR